MQREREREREREWRINGVRDGALDVKQKWRLLEMVISEKDN